MTDTITIVRETESSLVVSDIGIQGRAGQDGAGSSWDQLPGKPTGLVSSSAQAASWSVATASYALNAGTTGSGDWQSLTGKPAGLVSSSAQVSYSGIVGKPAGLVSSSAQVDYSQIQNPPTSIASASWAVSASYAPADWNGLTGKPAGLVSSSTQVQFASVGGLPSGLVSGSSQAVTWTVATASRSTTSSYASVAQTLLGSVTSASYSTTASLALNALTASFFSGTVDFPNGLAVTGSTTSTTGFTGSLLGTASYASAVPFTGVQGTPSLVSSSTQVAYSGITGVPAGLVSASSQVSFTGLGSLPAGLVSSSTQVDYNGIQNKPTTIATASYVAHRSNILLTIGTNSGSLSAFGYKGMVELADNEVLTTASMYTSGSGGLHWDIRRLTTGYDFSQTAGSSVTGSAPFSSSNQTSYVSPLTGWTTALNRGDILTFHLLAASGSVSNATVKLTLEK